MDRGTNRESFRNSLLQKRKKEKTKSINRNFCKTPQHPATSPPIASQERSLRGGKNILIPLHSVVQLARLNPLPCPLRPAARPRNWQKRGRFVFRPAPSRSIKIRPVSRDVDAFSEAGWALPVRPGERRGRWQKRESECSITVILVTSR